MNDNGPYFGEREKGRGGEGERVGENKDREERPKIKNYLNQRGREQCKKQEITL
jgi:hypothetical protein